MQTIRYALQDGIATVTFDEPNSPVNTMCLQWQQDMDALAAQVLQDKDSIQGIILASAKSCAQTRSFCSPSGVRTVASYMGMINLCFVSAHVWPNSRLGPEVDRAHLTP